MRTRSVEFPMRKLRMRFHLHSQSTLRSPVKLETCCLSQHTSTRTAQRINNKERAFSQKTKNTPRATSLARQEKNDSIHEPASTSSRRNQWLSQILNLELHSLDHLRACQNRNTDYTSSSLSNLPTPQAPKRSQ